jgi:hypothetical protein
MDHHCVALRKSHLEFSTYLFRQVHSLQEPEDIRTVLLLDVLFVIGGDYQL